MKIFQSRSFEQKVKKFNTPEKKVTLHPKIKDIKKCSLIFICASEQPYLRNLLEPLQNERILTVADMPEFLEKGGMINFLIKKSKVRFEINTAALKRVKLAAHAKLLRLAVRILEKDDLEKSKTRSKANS